MTGYTKLFGSIIASTIWRESKETKIVWITMLAMANKFGVVEASVPGLADFSRVTVPECEAALKILSEPDAYSRTKDHEGRRIEPVDGGWRLLNHAKYRAKMSVDDRREYLRIKQEERRKRLKDNTAPHHVNTVSTSVNKGQHSQHMQTHNAKADAEPKADSKRLNDERCGDGRSDRLNGNRSSLIRSSEARLMTELRELLGKDEMERAGGHWRKDWVRAYPELVERGLADLRERLKPGNGAIENRAAFVEDLLKRWR